MPESRKPAKNDTIEIEIGHCALEDLEKQGPLGAMVKCYRCGDMSRILLHWDKGKQGVDRDKTDPFAPETILSEIKALDSKMGWDLPGSAVEMIARCIETLKPERRFEAGAIEINE
jgi:hypothetical protein